MSKLEFRIAIARMYQRTGADAYVDDDGRVWIDGRDRTVDTDALRGEGEVYYTDTTN